MRLTLQALAALVNLAVAISSLNHVVHERRALSTGSRWVKGDRLDEDTILPIKIALKQNNLHRAHEYIMDVSDPMSANYGKHWSDAKIASTFAPGKDTLSAVTDWLVKSDIPRERHAVSRGQHWIHFNATVAEVERLLATEYFVYEHEESGNVNVACESYSVPELIREHIDLITPTVHFSNRIENSPSLKNRKSSNGSLLRRQGLPSPPPLRDPNDITQCDGNTIILPSCIRALYGIPEGDLVVEAPNSFTLAEYEAWYNQTDLDQWMNYTLGVTGVTPIAISIDGGDAAELIQLWGKGTDGYLLEPQLDLDIAVPLVYPLNVTFISTGDYILKGTVDLFLDAIDATYCDYDGGDDPKVDPQYPDPYNQPGAYNHTRECGTHEQDISNVISTSYGKDEDEYTAHYMLRQCYEYMKLGLKGITMINSSGDGGVNGNGFCGTPDYNQTVFRVTFPNSCPWITSVGGTMIRPNASAADPNNEVCAELETDIEQYKSGGGFSTLFPLPSYQADAVGTYWSQHAPNVSASVAWNNSQTTRGVPDVAFTSVNYVTFILNEYQLVSGTSASAPGFASVIARINQARLNAGKSRVGFINPILYANPQVFNDITEGGNVCGQEGFLAVQGWDPVTGLGTPRFNDMLELFMAQP